MGRPSAGFGSYGSYCIQVEGHRLLEYATGVERVTYQVARLHDDVLEMLPDVLDAVPESVVAHFRDGSLLATRDALLAIANKRPLEDPLWDALEGFRLACPSVDTPNRPLMEQHPETGHQ